MGEFSLSEAMLTAIGEYRVHYAGKTLLDWSVSVTDAVEDDVQKKAANFFPAFTYKSHFKDNIDKVGGSFPRIEPTQLQAFTEQLFGDEVSWVHNYINEGELPAESDKQAALGMMDDVMVAMFDFSPGEKEQKFNAKSFTEYVKDAQLFDGELNQLLEKSGMYKKDKTGMGEYGPKIAMLIGTLITSQADIDDADKSGFPIRYMQAEYDAFISPEAKKRIVANKVLPNESVIYQMNVICGPYITPPALPDTNASQLAGLGG